jgi:hypothetical protein
VTKARRDQNHLALRLGQLEELNLVRDQLIRVGFHGAIGDDCSCHEEYIRVDDPKGIRLEFQVRPRPQKP